MNETGQPENDLKSEFEKLGQNLKSTFETAWESEERKSLQRDLEEGLRHLGDTFDEMAYEIKNSQASKQVRQEFEDFGERVRSNEVQSKVRAELLQALQSVNRELEKFMGGHQDDDPEA